MGKTRERASASAKNGSFRKKALAFLAGLPKPKRIALLAGSALAAALLIAGLVFLGIYLFSPPVTVRVIHPFESPAWKAALEAESDSFNAKRRRIRVELAAMEYAEIHDAVRSSKDWDVAIGSSAFIGMEDSFAEPAIPFTGTIWGLYYNKEVLAEARLAEAFPNGEYSLEDFEKAMDAVKKSGKTPIALGSQFIWPLAAWIQAIMAVESPDDATLLVEKDYNLSSPRLESAIAKFSSYIASGYVSPGHRSQDWPSSVRETVSGRAGFCLVNEEFISSLLPAERAKIGYLPLPSSVRAGKTEWAIGSLAYIGRSKDSANPGAADAFFRSITSEESAARLSKEANAPFFARGKGPNRMFLSIASKTTHPLMRLLRENS